MSFRTTREVCEHFRDAYCDAKRWCSQLGKSHPNTEVATAASLAAKELSARSKSFQAAIEAAQSKTLKTYMQYEPTEILHQALHRLTTSDPKDAESLLGSISDFYKVAVEGLTECETSGGSTLAEELFTEMEREAHTGIASLAWQRAIEPTVLDCLSRIPRADDVDRHDHVDAIEVAGIDGVFSG